MPTVTINGTECTFEKGQSILEIALANDTFIPHYCYHPALSAPANCRICLAEVWSRNPRNDNKLEPIPKLLPTCQTEAGDGQVIYTDSPKAVANQRAVMEYLLINHPVDCAVCDQAGECSLQDYSYQYGRAQSRFTDEKIKAPKKDVGGKILLYSDRCIMCTRCVRFTREITGTSELLVHGRGAHEQIDVFPGMGLDNELAGNVVDICPVGALLDKDFLFQQRVWFLTSTPSIDGLTCSGDHILIEHNKGVVHRLKPRPNPAHGENGQYWITDELRYGWSFVHDESRLLVPSLLGEDPYDAVEAPLAWESAIARTNEGFGRAGRVGAMISPMLSCEDAWHLATWVRRHDADAVLAVGPVPTSGEDKTFKDGYVMYAEKAPNARGVRRVLEALGGEVLDAGAFAKRLAANGELDAVLLTGNYPSAWVTDDLRSAIGAHDRFVTVIDTLDTGLTRAAPIAMPGATWLEKAGTFEDVHGRVQAFERSIEPVDFCKTEAQIAIDLISALDDERPARFNAANTRAMMSAHPGLEMFASVAEPVIGAGEIESAMEIVEL